MKFEKIKYIERKTGEIKVEKVMGEKALEFLYYNPFGKLALETVVKRKFYQIGMVKKCQSQSQKKKLSLLLKKWKST